MDTFSKQKRSWVMSRITGKNTAPEIALRRFLHRMGRDPIGACCDGGPSQSCPPTRASPSASPEEANR